MSSTSDETKDIVFKWFYRSKLDHYDLYINLFISYNAWFKKVTGESRDRTAIIKLKKRSAIWQDYTDGLIFQNMKTHVEQVVALTNVKPLSNLTGDNMHWDGIINDAYDWQSLIEFWYRVRCNIFHGQKSPEDERDTQVVRLAYETLYIFMAEIVQRMERNFTKEDLIQLGGLGSLDKLLRVKHDNTGNNQSQDQEFTDKLAEISIERRILIDKLSDAYNLWDVDMVRIAT